MPNNLRRAWLGVITIPLAMLAALVRSNSPSQRGRSDRNDAALAPAGPRHYVGHRLRRHERQAGIPVQLQLDGVRTLNPPSVTAFSAGRVDTFNLKLFDTPSQLTMFRIGSAGSDDWCIKKVELIFNERVAFAQDAVAGGSACAAVKSGTYLEYTSAQLRSNSSWVAYGTPPALPLSPTSATARAMMASVTGSALLSSPGVTWDLTKPFTIVRRNSDSLGISFGVVISDSSGIGYPFKATIAYGAQPYMGTDRRLHVRNVNPSCCYHGTMSDTAVTQLDQALTRMTRSTLGQRHLFSIDSNVNINWLYSN